MKALTRLFAPPSPGGRGPNGPYPNPAAATSVAITEWVLVYTGTRRVPSSRYPNPAAAGSQVASPGKNSTAAKPSIIRTT
jgi:hypothetical protein